MTKKSRISYPAVYDLSKVILLVRVLLRSSLPLTALCDDKKIRDNFKKTISAWRKTHGINNEVIAFASILNLITKRKFEVKDAKTKIPELDICVGDVFLKMPNKSKVDYLTPKGITLALTEDGRYLLFESILANKVLPDYFAKAIQCERLYEETLSLEELEKELHIQIHKKRPEGKCIIRWSQFFGISSVKKGLMIKLDRKIVAHFLLYCIKDRLENLLLKREAKAFDEVRTQILKDLNLYPTFPFDEFFEVLYRYQKEGTISFKSGRESFVGGWKGSSNFAFISLSSKLVMPTMSYTSTIFDHLKLKIGV
jgi:hypothetical protein